MSNKAINTEDKIAGSTALILNYRPTQIPAKSYNEQLEHEKLHKKILQNVKKKGDFNVKFIYVKILHLIFIIIEFKEAEKHKENLKQKLKNEEQLAKIIQIWTQEIIPNWDQM